MALGLTKAPSAFEFVDLVQFAVPLVRAGQGLPALGDHRPGFRQLGIQRDETALILRHVIFGEYRFGRTLGDAQRAIDAFIRVNREKVGPFVKAIDGANIDTIGIFALDAVLSNNVGHFARHFEGGRAKTIAHLYAEWA